jgi:two-component system nitrate/nitrite response regulator NarL
MPTVLIVEDHRLLAEVLRAALAQHDIEAEIAAPAAAEVLLARLLAARPALVLLDLDLGAHGDSTGLIAPLGAAGIRTLVVSGSTDRERIAVAFEAGAFGYHAKADSFDLLVAKALAGLTSAAPLDEPLRRELCDDLARARRSRTARLEPFERLTDRERDTLLALSTGRSVHDIAVAWVVSEATVRSHVRGVLAKLDAPSQLAAVAMALRSGWLPVAS